MSSALEAVARAAQGELGSEALPGPGAGRFEGRGGPDVAFVLEAVREGYLMHYEEPRAFSRAMDPDMRLLAGDALYALGLSRLAELGDLGAVAELADLITGCARARIEGRPELAEELWEASAARLSGEPSAGAAATLVARLGPPPARARRAPEAPPGGLDATAAGS